MDGFPPGLSLRQVTATDLSAFGEFSRRTFVNTYGPLQALQRMVRHVEERLNDQRLRDELADPTRTVLALQQGDAWVAYAMLHGGAANPDVLAERPVEVERFYVDHAWHGRGAAAPFMESALDTARALGHDVAWLGVWQQNPRAVRFYEKQGFRIVGHQIYHFDGTPEDDHVMACVL